jgi:hypothetical protein
VPFVVEKCMDTLSSRDLMQVPFTKEGKFVVPFPGMEMVSYPLRRFSSSWKGCKPMPLLMK